MSAIVCLEALHAVPMVLHVVVALGHVPMMPQAARKSLVVDAVFQDMSVKDSDVSEDPISLWLWLCADPK
jgi:hypothetical protein